MDDQSLEALITILSFYAAPSNYTAFIVGGIQGSQIDKDGGARAREVLASLVKIDPYADKHETIYLGPKGK